MTKKNKARLLFCATVGLGLSFVFSTTDLLTQYIYDTQDIKNVEGVNISDNWKIQKVEKTDGVLFKLKPDEGFNYNNSAKSKDLENEPFQVFSIEINGEPVFQANMYARDLYAKSVTKAKTKYMLEGSDFWYIIEFENVKSENIKYMISND